MSSLLNAEALARTHRNYEGSTIGQALTKTLTTMYESGSITDEEARSVMTMFNKTLHEELLTFAAKQHKIDLKLEVRKHALNADIKSPVDIIHVSHVYTLARSCLQLSLGSRPMPAPGYHLLAIE